ISRSIFFSASALNIAKNLSQGGGKAGRILSHHRDTEAFLCVSVVKKVLLPAFPPPCSIIGRSRRTRCPASRSRPPRRPSCHRGSSRRARRGGRIPAHG